METNADLSSMLYELLESVLSSKGLVHNLLALVVKVSQFKRGAVLLETCDHDLELKTHVGFLPTVLAPSNISGQHLLPNRASFRDRR
jgi:hypothetical protein